MELITTIADLQARLNTTRESQQTIGLVPTMGALHKGHASLVERSLRENDVTVVSIFVNPTQFNNKQDLATYPRTLEADRALLDTLGATYVFAPSVEEIYPEEDTRMFSYPPVDTVMEGERRPGHFNGVCQIVSKLFTITRPHRAYFGEKDFQQIAVIRQMVKAEGFNLEVVACPIVRETSGLALSSRNQLMTAQERNLAVNISRILFVSLEYAKNHTIVETQDFVVNTLNSLDGLEVEYFQIVDGYTLQPVTSWDSTSYIVGCITVFCGATPIRLIDNVCYIKH